MKTLSAKDFNLYHLGTIPVSYPPKGINTEAIQATPENIGMLAVELETGLRYFEADSRPYMLLKLAREEDTVTGTAQVPLRLGDWLVALWDELHVFRDLEFKNTFTINGNAPRHELSVDHSSPTEFQRFEGRVDEAIRDVSVHQKFVPTMTTGDWEELPPKQ